MGSWLSMSNILGQDDKEEVGRIWAVHLSKSFSGRRVLNDVSMRVRAGELHALVGANGSGKSTFIKCLTGVQAPDAGATIEIGGRLVPTSFGPKGAAALGLRVVHQDAPLIDALSLCDVLALYRGFPTRMALVQQRQLERETRTLLSALDVDIDPSTRTGDLTPAERAMVMLALAMSDIDGRRGVVVLDESTAHIPVADARRFLESVEIAADRGVGVVIVTHRLSEVFDFCTHVTALRGGEVVLQAPISECTRDDLVHAIVGNPSADKPRDMESVRICERFSPLLRTPQDVHHVNADAIAVLEMDDVYGRRLTGFNLSVAPGEIVGVCGIVGSGATELGRLLSGIQEVKAGSISVGGVTLGRRTSPRRVQKLGLGYVPGDRLNEGGVVSLTVRDNVALPNLNYYGVSRQKLESDVRELIDIFDVRPSDPNAVFGSLSGGNQQKVVIGKVALLRPKVFVLDDPTAGVDPGAREEIYAVLRGISKSGTAIVLISSEPSQLVGLADRVVIVRDGRQIMQLQDSDISEFAISNAMS